MRRSYNFVLSNCIWRLNRTKTNKTDRSRIKYTPLSGTIDEINRKRAYRVIWNHSLLFFLFVVRIEWWGKKPGNLCQIMYKCRARDKRIYFKVIPFEYGLYVCGPLIYLFIFCELGEYSRAVARDMEMH